MTSPRIFSSDPPNNDKSALLCVVQDDQSTIASLWWAWRVDFGVGSDGVAELRVCRSVASEGIHALSRWASQNLDRLGAPVIREGQRVWQVEGEQKLQELLGTVLAKLYESRYYLFTTRSAAESAARTLADTIDRMGLAGFVRMTDVSGERSVREAAGPQV